MNAANAASISETSSKGKKDTPKESKTRQNCSKRCKKEKKAVLRWLDSSWEKDYSSDVK